jgi:hypothetical protein
MKLKKGDAVILKETGEFFTIEEIRKEQPSIGIKTSGLSLWVDEEDVKKLNLNKIKKVI